MDELGVLRERIDRVEEAMGFAQHDQDALSAQLAAVQRDVRALEARLRRIEVAIERASAQRDASTPDAEGGEA